MNTATIELYLREKIPLAKAMNIAVVRAEEARIELSCSLSINHNHMGTAFGGSLCSLMILAAYCRMFYLQKGHGHAIIRRSSQEFLKPVREDLRAISFPPSVAQVEEFNRVLKRFGQASLDLTSEIRLLDGSVAARLNGEFVGVIPRQLP